jgi:chromosome segregation ATPase
MRTRYKILILLITATVGLGTFIFLYSTDDALHRFRLLLFKDPRQLLAEVTLSAGNAEGLGYGAIALFAIIVIGLAIKMARDGELRAFSDRLVQLEVAKAELETSLQDSMWKEKHARAAKDAAMKDLEASVSRLVATEHRIAEHENLLQNRDRELEALRFQMATLAQQPNRAASPVTREENLLREELRKKSDLLEARDATINQLEKHLVGKVHALEAQQHVKEKLLAERDVELEALKGQLTKAATAKNQAERLLAEELRKEKLASQSKDSAIRELEKNLSGKVHALTLQLTEKQELLQVRDAEMEGLRAEVNALTGQLTEAGSAKARAENLLQQELKNKTELLNSKDAAFKELHESSRATIHDLEKQLSEKETLFRDHKAELETLRTELTKSGTAKNRAESFLAEELRKQKQAFEAKDAAMRELEKNLSAKLHLLNVQLIDKQELLQVRSTEIEAFRADVNVMRGQLAEAASAKARAENLLQQELKNKTELLNSKDAAFKELHESSRATIYDLEKQLSEKEAFFKDHNAELDVLRMQLSKMASAKNESEDILRDEISKMKGVLDAKNSTVRELEQSLKETVDALESQAGEHQTLLQKRDRDLQALRSEVEIFKAQPAKTGSVIVRTPALLPTELPQGNTLSKLEESSKRVRALETLLSEKEDLLKIHDEKITRLESELKAKRTELARHEITVWQSIERRDLWKRRLAKFGIPLKQR